MIDNKQLRELIIRPVLKDIGYYSAAAEELLMLTIAQESGGGRFLHQLGKGPATGIYQMEPATHDDIWQNFLRYNDTLAAKVRRWNIPFAYQDNDAEELAGNLYYATAMARMHYLRVPERLPAADDIQGLAEYYKKYYNTAAGAATVEEAIENYHRYAV